MPPTRSPTYACSDGAAARRRRAGRGRRPSRSAIEHRLPQRAGDRARPNGHDLLPDGLRHHRHRARLLAGQVQGARRRRSDDDRQPDGAAGAADARLQRRADRADRRLRQRARDDRRSARPGRRAPAGVRRGGRRAGDLPHGPPEDDGRDPAVHERRDLEDREHAPDGDGRGHRRGLHGGAGGSGIKALAIYRDGSKTAQALRTEAQKDAPASREAEIQKAVAEALAKAPVRRRMPRERQSITHKFSIGGHEGYITAGMYDDGQRRARSSLPTSARKARRCAG